MARFLLASALNVALANALLELALRATHPVYRVAIVLLATLTRGSIKT